jgi:hypothetical protein
MAARARRVTKLRSWPGPTSVETTRKARGVTVQMLPEQSWLAG